MNSKIETFISTKKYIIVLFSLLALISSMQSLFQGKKNNVKDGIEYNYYSYNNYVIFAKSFYHLKENKDLYVLYPNEQWDLYKYTPTFSVFMGFFAIFPDWIGLNLWNLLNALILLFAIYYLPKLGNLSKGLVLVISIIELWTAMRNEQSNGLLAGLMIFSFGLLENRKYLLATLCIVFSVYIKLFGLLGFIMFLLYPGKWKLALFSAFWTVILFLLPLVFVHPEQYMKLIQSFLYLLSNDHSTSNGISVMGLVNTWFSTNINKNIIVLIGAVILILPFSRIKEYSNYTFRFLALASVLIWMVIFNHKAESPTFIIAMAGVAIWFIAGEKNVFNIILFTICFILTVLSPTDIFPAFLRDEFVEPYCLKALPCILVWIKIIYEMFVLKTDTITKKYTNLKIEIPTNG